MYDTYLSDCQALYFFFILCLTITKGGCINSLRVFKNKKGVIEVDEVKIELKDIMASMTVYCLNARDFEKAHVYADDLLIDTLLAISANSEYENEIKQIVDLYDSVTKHYS
jgi:hypothetical protein